METLGDRMRRIREDKGVSREALGRKVGLSYTGIASIEAGQSKSTSKLHRIAQALRVDVEYLETGREHDKPVAPLDASAVEDVIAVLREEAADVGRVYDDTQAREFVDYYNMLALAPKVPESRRDMLALARRLARATAGDTERERSEAPPPESHGTGSPQQARRHGGRDPSPRKR